MKSTKRWRSVLALLFAFAIVAAACGDGDSETTTTAAGGDTTAATTAAPGGVPADDFQIGIFLVGPGNDRGYSQAHLEGVEYAIEKLGRSVDDDLIVLEFANFGDTPGL